MVIWVYPIPVSWVGRDQIQQFIPENFLNLQSEDGWTIRNFLLMARKFSVIPSTPSMVGPKGFNSHCLAFEKETKVDK